MEATAGTLKSRNGSQQIYRGSDQRQSYPGGKLWIGPATATGEPNSSLFSQELTNPFYEVE